MKRPISEFKSTADLRFPDDPAWSDLKACVITEHGEREGLSRRDNRAGNNSSRGDVVTHITE